MDFRPSCPDLVDRLGFEYIACLKIVLQLSHSQVKAEASFPLQCTCVLCASAIK
jgi:hypothetical protein